MTHRDKLLEAAYLYCESTSVTLSTASTRALNDGKGLKRIEGGGDCTLKTYERAMAWFAANTPGV